MHNPFTFLALGDSYTIGEAVLLHENFPYQCVQQLRTAGITICAPEIVAKTGWTTEELQSAINSYSFLNRYDFVSLLIGVNNQYRGGDVMQFKMDLEQLIKKAIDLAHGKSQRVALVSIPDYSVMPFTAQMDRPKITREVDIYNNVVKALSIQYKTHFIDITAGSRDAENDAELVAADQLHPSSKEYRKWSEKLAEVMAKELK
jgi:lysophospholipase L1-like esterase